MYDYNVHVAAGADLGGWIGLALPTESMRKWGPFASIEYHLHIINWCMVRHLYANK